MRKLPLIALASAAVAGAALAAKPASHVMDVPLPDGSVAHIEYVGNVAPKVTVAPGPLAEGAWAPMPFPSFAGFDRMIREMNRRTEEMIRQSQQMARHAPMAGAPYVAAYGDAPAGTASTTVVSVSNGGSTCTRTTEVVSQGPGKPPKLTSSVSGNCAEPGSGAVPAPKPSGAALDRT